MSNPLHKIYNTLNDVSIANKMQARIVRFKNLGDRLLDDNISCFYTVNEEYDTCINDPFFLQRSVILSHDQEPLLYHQQKEKWKRWRFNTSPFDDRMIILTSELNSNELKDFCDDFGAIPCHWFSNGVLAHTWYQNSRWDLRLKMQIPRPRLHYKFSSMNRLISHQRSYRPIISKFLADNIDNRHLRLSCMLTDPIQGLTAIENNIPDRYKRAFKNTDFKNPILINVPQEDLELGKDDVIANKSFNYSNQFFDKVFCHIATETLFTESTLHLTEKSLRAFVNQRPMILIGPPHSLEYLRSYGFQTWSNFWDESYDTIEDPWLRLDKIMHIITDLARKSLDEMEDMLDAMQPILLHNYRHFHQDFPDVILDQLMSNFLSAISQSKQKSINGWMYSRIKSLSEARLKGLLNSPIIDEYKNAELYQGYIINDMSKIDLNIGRLLIAEHGIDKGSSKDEILARFNAALD